MVAFAWFDYLIVGLYLAITVVIGMYVSAYIQTGRDFFLAGRTLPWWAIGLSLIATDLGGAHLIHGSAAGYRDGIAAGNTQWIGTIPAMMLAAFIFVPHFWRCGVTTIPEFLEKRFHVGIRTAVAVCWVVFMACQIGVILLASAKWMFVLAGWPAWWTIGLIAAMGLFYTWSGGLAGIVYTDVLQGLVTITACAAVVAIGVWQAGGIGPLKDQINRSLAIQKTAKEPTPLEPMPSAGPRHEHFTLVQPVQTSSPYPWTGILFGLTFIVSPSYWIGHQAVVQRALGARSAYDARASYVWGALLKNFAPILIVVPGLIALSQFPALSDPDQALPKAVGLLLPVGLKGLFLAAFLAGLMSAVNASLNAAATIVANDFYLRFVRQNADERRMLQIGRLVTIVLMMWGVGFAIWFQANDSGMSAIFPLMTSFFSGPALAVLLAGLLTTQATGRGALIGFIGGVATSVTLFLLNHPVVLKGFHWRPLFLTTDPFLYIPIWSFLMTAVLTALVSYGAAAEPPEKRQYVLGGLKKGAAV